MFHRDLSWFWYKHHWPFNNPFNASKFVHQPDVLKLVKHSLQSDIPQLLVRFQVQQSRTLCMAKFTVPVVLNDGILLLFKYCGFANLQDFFIGKWCENTSCVCTDDPLHSSRFVQCEDCDIRLHDNCLPHLH